MADREKIFHGLYSCGCDHGIPNICEVTECPYRYGTPWCVHDLVKDASELISELMEAQKITGETSDGYHTFNELYHHRAVLFSVIVAEHKERAWKSKKHHDGTMYEGMFIVGIDTPDGQATYHYDIDPYWDMFDCKALENAPEWDGHTPDQAIERIGKLKAWQEQRHRLWVHNIGNVDVPEGVTWEQFQSVMSGVVKALEHTDRGESWPYDEEGR